ncbi:uncharacterized protein PODANS_7_3120 [Podospora anserina S mat+]|uniref:Podospora anserina S mat+ genomic DNA chromosome 7, supercontig 1 n=3 Tax=Podospora TaxID=5144 RepID=B2AVF5_PODAN|nr:uncharacterized protein PODANS_7_3120 [Podospora anserina S mat+]KAK4650021.1 hypothetical protein QC762_703120 [Podospora pseudocomata]CAP68379.1 unnamed protein product [Podospora anserina S mat+]CDP31851.1 Putative protein of unknown function [Podospora anserina S mat+]VBB86336.1 Putative protein of unknown function [Podospora comata]
MAEPLWVRHGPIRLRYIDNDYLDSELRALFAQVQFFVEIEMGVCWVTLPHPEVLTAEHIQYIQSRQPHYSRRSRRPRR